ncbi:MAG: Gfo/Idh/MocA family oxidoreductase [Gemmatimonadota bacterium]|nr:MAG: Gfo/Idh/MocA family oxidoreductase [Gemmatimonadota bacterium]
MDKIRIGFVGCGVASVLHIHALKSVPNVQILWFCDKNEISAHRAMKLWGKEGTIGDDFERLLSDAKPNVIHVCTPPHTHADFSISALKSGCHVLLEKPMATTVEEAKRILEARDCSGSELCMMHNHMFDPPIQKMRRAVQNGKLGELIYGEGQYFLDMEKMAQEHLDRPDHWVHTLKSGIAGEFMPHTIYLLQSFLGPCRELQLMEETARSTPGEEYQRKSFAVQLRFRNAIGRILLIDCMPYGHFNIDLYGTRAAAHINMMDLTFSIERIRGNLPLVAARMGSTVEQSFQRMWQTLSNSVRIVTGQLKRRPGHRALIQTFYSAIRSGNPVPIPAEDGLATVQTMVQLDRIITDRDR